MNDQIQYVGQTAVGYNSQARTEHPQARMAYETWLSELGDVRDLQVLDLACGGGYTSRMLADRGAIVVGVDISPAQISEARRVEEANPRGIAYLVRDVATLDLPTEFDIVCPTFLLNYADTEAQLLRFATAAARHLKHGGRLVGLNASTNPIVPRLPNANHSTEWVDGDEPYAEGSRVRKYFYDLHGNDVCSIVFRYWSRQTYERILSSVGFDDVQWIPYRMSDEGKSILSNWRSLVRHNSSTVFSAVRR